MSYNRFQNRPSQPGGRGAAMSGGGNGYRAQSGYGGGGGGRYNDSSFSNANNGGGGVQSFTQMSPEELTLSLNPGWLEPGETVEEVLAAVRAKKAAAAAAAQNGAAVVTQAPVTQVSTFSNNTPVTQQNNGVLPNGVNSVSNNHQSPAVPATTAQIVTEEKFSSANGINADVPTVQPIARYRQTVIDATEKNGGTPQYQMSYSGGVGDAHQSAVNVTSVDSGMDSSSINGGYGKPAMAEIKAPVAAANGFGTPNAVPAMAQVNTPIVTAAANGFGTPSAVAATAQVKTPIVAATAHGFGAPNTQLQTPIVTTAANGFGTPSAVPATQVKTPIVAAHGFGALNSGPAVAELKTPVTHSFGPHVNDSAVRQNPFGMCAQTPVVNTNSPAFVPNSASGGVSLGIPGNGIGAANSSFRADQINNTPSGFAVQPSAASVPLKELTKEVKTKSVQNYVEGLPDIAAVNGIQGGKQWPLVDVPVREHVSPSMPISHANAGEFVANPVIHINIGPQVVETGNDVHFSQKGSRLVPRIVISSDTPLVGAATSTELTDCANGIAKVEGQVAHPEPGPFQNLTKEDACTIASISQKFFEAYTEMNAFIQRIAGRV